MSQKTSESVDPAKAAYEAKAKKVINRAARIATTAHKDQKRKYTGLDYITHPAAVVDIVSKIEAVATSERAYEDIAAAYLHDVIEDCGVTPEQLMNDLKGPCTDEEAQNIVQLVGELTNVSIAPEHKGKPRDERKAMDREHISKASVRAQRIKLADRLHNISDMLRTLTETPIRGAIFDPVEAPYATKYLRETLELVAAIGHAEPKLAGMIRNRLLTISDLELAHFKNEKKDNHDPLGVFAEAIAVKKYVMSCVKCKANFELTAYADKTVEGKELTCPICEHKAIYLLVTKDHQ